MSKNTEVQSDESTVPHSRPVIMLIEDDGLLLRMYQKKLELDGYEVVVAVNGKEGLQLIKDKMPDLILCDVMMPEVNGFEVLAAVKKDEATKHIPVIMLTNLSSETEAERAIVMGAVTYLIKSNVMPADVVAKVKEILDASGAAQIPVGVAVNA